MTDIWKDLDVLNERLTELAKQWGEKYALSAGIALDKDCELWLSKYQGNWVFLVEYFAEDLGDQLLRNTPRSKRFAAAEMLPKLEEELVAEMARERRKIEDAMGSVDELMESMNDKPSPKAAPGRLISISDDDLCATCKHCIYNPGGQSGCWKEWPCKFDEDGYVVMCKLYEEKTDEQD